MAPALLNPMLGTHLEHWQLVCCPGQSSPSIPLLDCPDVRSGMNLRLRRGQEKTQLRHVSACSCLSALMNVLPWLCGLATQSYSKNSQLAIYWLDGSKVVNKE